MSHNVVAFNTGYPVKQYGLTQCGYIFTNPREEKAPVTGTYNTKVCEQCHTFYICTTKDTEYVIV